MPKSISTQPKPKAKPKAKPVRAAKASAARKPKAGRGGMVLLDRNSEAYRVARASALRKLRTKNPKGAIVLTLEEDDATTPPLKPGQESMYDVLVRTGMLATLREIGEERAKDGLPPLDEERN